MPLLNAIHSNPNPYQYQFTHINKDQAPSGSALAGICLTLQPPLITQTYPPPPPPSRSHTALDFGVNKADRLCESIDSYQKMPLM